ncbi:MAG: hypothetical protein NDJ89_04020 [Oligoflexia bacterium]|nr:hypothetical protein [Oligoflexia bacterium]
MKKNIATAGILGLTALSGSAHSAWGMEQIIRPYQSVRSAAMGGLRTTTGKYEENFFGNPARMLANPKSRVTIFDFMAEINSGVIDNIGELTDSSSFYGAVGATAGTNNHVRLQMTWPSFFFPLRGGKSALGVGLIMSMQGDLNLRRSYELKPDVLMDFGPAVTYAQKFLPNDALGVGVTMHAAYRLQSDISIFDLIKGKSFSVDSSGSQGAHIDFDLGATYLLPIQPFKEIDFSASASVNNLLGGNYANLPVSPIPGIGLKPRPQPRTLGLGLSLHKDAHGRMKDTTVALEVNDIGNSNGGSFYRLLHLGGETHYGVLALRAGLSQGYFAGGLGLNLKVFNLDLATYGEEMTLNPGGMEDRRYSLKLSFQI